MNISIDFCIYKTELHWWHNSEPFITTFSKAYLGNQENSMMECNMWQNDVTVIQVDEITQWRTGGKHGDLRNFGIE